ADEPNGSDLSLRSASEEKSQSTLDEGASILMPVPTAGATVMLLALVWLFRRIIVSFRRQVANTLRPKSPQPRSIVIRCHTPNRRQPQTARNICASIRHSYLKVQDSNDASLHVGLPTPWSRHLVVYEALFRPNDRLNEPPMKVAVKCLKGSFDQYIDRDVRELFYQECAIMVDFCHANVMPLLGVNLHDNDGNIDPKLILPFCANGNVHNFVSSAENVTTSPPIYAAEVVHRDLAARNILLDENMSIVISNFGLSRAVQQLQGETYVVKRNRSTPWQWAAPEVLESCQFSTKSDVWSFGVVVWEMLEKGSVPYGEIHDEDQALAFLRSGGRLRWPTFCPANFWSADQMGPAADPDVVQLVSRPAADPEVVQLVSRPAADHEVAQLVCRPDGTSHRS
ncbi:putative Tyrosine-protein kinase receptor svh-2, partial [Hypsibius exemplaris]